MKALALLSQSIGLLDEAELRWCCNEAIAIFERSTAGAQLDSILLYLPHLIRQAGHEYGTPGRVAVLGSHGEEIGDESAQSVEITAEVRNTRGHAPDAALSDRWHRVDAVLRRVSSASSPTLAHALRTYYGPLGEQWASGSAGRLLGEDFKARAGHSDRLCALYHLVPEGVALIADERAAAAGIAERALAIVTSEPAEVDPQQRRRRKRRRKERRAEKAHNVARSLVEVTDEKAMIAVLCAPRSRSRGAKLAAVRAAAFALRAAAWQAWAEARRELGITLGRTRGGDE